jgi:hypothetical protein
VTGFAGSCDSGSSTILITAGSKLSLKIDSSGGAGPADALFGWRLR